MDHTNPVYTAVVSFGFPLALAVVILVAYRRVHLRSLLWLLAYEVLLVIDYAAARQWGDTLFVTIWRVSPVVFLIFLILLTRELRELQTAARDVPAAPGGESPGAA